MRKVYLTWRQVQGHCIEIARQLQQDNWRPDYIVGITRGGAVPAVLISQYLDLRCEMLKVSLRNDENTESNLWMAEDAFGYVPKEERSDSEAETEIARRRNILIVDDINDTGATIGWIKKDWTSGCLPNSHAWQHVWHNNVKFATIVSNESSTHEVDYSAVQINKLDDPQWVVFPWEDWWR